MFFMRRRLEEDLERIRRANLPPEKLAAEEEQERLQAEERKRLREENALEPMDIPAMIIAVFSVIMPYVLIFFAVMGFVVLLFYLFLFR